MKLLVTLLIFLHIPPEVLSQTDQSIDLITGLEYSYRRLSSNSEDEIVKQIVDRRDRTEAQKTNWRLGINYNKRVSNDVYLKSGLRLASVGYKGENQTELRWLSEFD